MREADVRAVYDQAEYLYDSAASPATALLIWNVGAGIEDHVFAAVRPVRQRVLRVADGVFRLPGLPFGAAQ